MTTLSIEYTVLSITTEMAAQRFVEPEMINLVTIIAHRLVKKFAWMVGMELTAIELSVVQAAINSMDIVKSQKLANAVLVGAAPDVMNALLIRDA